MPPVHRSFSTPLVGALLLSLLGACADRPPPRGPAGPSREPAPARPPGTAARPAAAPAPVIHPDGVGDLRLGRAIPAAYLAASARPEDAFQVLHYADGQEAEAFRLPGLPVVVALVPPKEDEARPAPDDAPPPTLAVRARSAVVAARAGRPIQFLVIEGPGPRTDRGIGVGSRVPDLEAAFGPVTLLNVPSTLGRDRCVVIPRGLPDLKLHFPDCAAARAGAGVTRILIWRDAP